MGSKAALVAVIVIAAAAIVAYPMIGDLLTTEEVQVTVDYDADSGVQSTLGSGKYTKGDEVTVSATMKGDYTFVGWYDPDGNRVSKENPYTFIADKNITLLAKGTTHPVTVTVAQHDHVMISGDGTYGEGELVTLMASPEHGYKFLSWTDDTNAVVCDTAVYTFKITGDIVLNVTSEKLPLHIITVNKTAGISAVTGGGEYLRDTTVTVRAELEPGMIFDGWMNGKQIVSKDLAYSFFVKSDVTLKATAHPDPDAVVVTVNKGPGIQAVIGGGDYSKGNYVTVSAAPYKGYSFQGWFDSDNKKVSSYPVYGFDAKSITLTAKAVKATGELDETPGMTWDSNNGIAGSSSADSGEYAKSFDMSADLSPGYSFKGWYDPTGNLVAKCNPLTVLFAGMTLKAEAVPSSVIEVYSDSGITAVSGTGTYGPYDTTTITVELEDGAEFVGWYDVRGNLVSKEPSYTVKTDDSSIYIARTDAPLPTGSETLTITGNPYDVKDCCTIVTDARGDYCMMIDGKSQKTIEGLPEGTYEVTYYGLADDKHYHSVTDSVRTDGEVTRYYTWTYEGEEYNLVWNTSVYEYNSYPYKDDRHPYESDHDELLIYTLHRDNMNEVVEQLRTLSATMDAQQRADFVLDFVQQSVEYEFDDEFLGVPDEDKEYWKYPMETLYDRAGDCEDGSLLYIYIMKELGYQTAMVLLPDHMMASVHIDAEIAGGTRITVGDVSYYLVETTNNVSDVGDNPGEYTTFEKVVQVPLNKA